MSLVLDSEAQAQYNQILVFILQARRQIHHSLQSQGSKPRILLQHILGQGLLCDSREGPRPCMLHTCLAGCTAYSAQAASP